MSFVFAAVAAVAAVNAPRLRPLVPQATATGRAATVVVAAGSAIAFGVMVGIAFMATSLLGWLDITEEMWRIATGLVVIAAGLRYVAFPMPGDEPELGGLRAAIVPVAFPLLVTPELFVLVVALSVGASVGTALGAVAVALATANVALMAPRGPKSGPWTAGARFHAAVLVVVGVAIVVDAIRDV